MVKRNYNRYLSFVCVYHIEHKKRSFGEMLHFVFVCLCVCVCLFVCVCVRVCASLVDQEKMFVYSVVFHHLADHKKPSNDIFIVVAHNLDLLSEGQRFESSLFLYNLFIFMLFSHKTNAERTAMINNFLWTYLMNLVTFLQI